MKLLFDQNLSPRLPRLLADVYAGSLHVRETGLRDAEDSAVWDYAGRHGFAIVSKDSDFQARSLLYGSPPKTFGPSPSNAAQSGWLGARGRTGADQGASRRIPVWAVMGTSVDTPHWVAWWVPGAVLGSMYQVPELGL